MKLGLFTVLFQQEPLEVALDKAQALGIEAVELGTGGYPGKAHCDPDALKTQESIDALLSAVESRGLTISALSVHGNPLHPDETLAASFHEDWRKTLPLAEKLGVEVVNVLSGCPGDQPGAKYPNWVTCPWPPDYLEVLEWQWREVALPYWREEVKHAQKHGVKVAVEMHPGFVVYNPETLLKLRGDVGDTLGCNFDPSHLFWLGVDPAEAVHVLGRAGALFHMHAKDTFLDRRNIRVNGVLDPKHYGAIGERSWTFRTAGYGQSEKTWRDLVSALRTVGYDGVVSIEHEDALLSVGEGLDKATRFLKRILVGEPAGEMWWA